MSPRRTVLQAACLLGLAVLLPGGCVISIDPIDGGDDDGNGGGADQITIRIVNATDHTLDPQIYLAAEPVDVDSLFTASRKYTKFGVGNLGLIGSFDADQFTVECSQARVVGTRGGSFGGGDDGNDLTAPAGSGTQLVLTQELVFFCGQRITFTYRSSGDGFSTTLDID